MGRNRNDVERLDEHRMVLVCDLNTLPVVEYLVSASVLQYHHQQEIESISNSAKQTRELLRILEKMGPHAFDKFLEALKATQQHELAKLLEEGDQPKIIREERSSSGITVEMDDEDNSQLTLQSILNEIQSNTCVIENWSKGALKGSGSFGDVYTCTNLANGQEVAGKYIRVSLPTQGIFPREKRRIQNDIEPVLKEVGIMLKLDHERVLKCFGYRTKGRDLVVFSELMSFGSVLDEMRRIGSALDSGTTARYLKQAAEGLVYIHSQGVIHRDLKCANLLLDGNKDVKLADFGISLEIRLKNGLTSSTFTENGNHSIKGSLSHMAPEALQSKNFTRKSDVWSMGCSVVEMLTTMAPHEEVIEGWEPSKFIFKAGMGLLKYVGRELCPNASVAMQTLLDKIFQPAEQRLTSEQLLDEVTAL